MNGPDQGAGSISTAKSLVSHFGTFDGEPLITAFIATSVMLAFYIFIWAFCRSFYIISLLDAGIWSELDLFGRVLGAADNSSRRVESVLRGLIIFFFLNHQILIADALGANLTEFYGMSRVGACDFSRIPHSDIRDFLSHIWPGISGQPFVCGLVNTVASTFDELRTIQHVATPLSDDAAFYQIQMVAISAFFVLVSILTWSFWTGGLYKKYRSRPETRELYNQSRKQFHTQRWACVLAGIPAIYIYFIAKHPPASGSMGETLLVIIPSVLVIASSLFFLAVVLGQIWSGIFGHRPSTDVVVDSISLAD